MPIFLEFGARLLVIDFLIDFSMRISGFDICLALKFSGLSFCDIVSKFVE